MQNNNLNYPILLYRQRNNILLLKIYLDFSFFFTIVIEIYFENIKHQPFHEDNIINFLFTKLSLQGITDRLTKIIYSLKLLSHI